MRKLREFSHTHFKPKWILNSVRIQKEEDKAAVAVMKISLMMEEKKDENVFPLSSPILYAVSELNQDFSYLTCAYGTTAFTDSEA